jgi:hypothetical protein
MGFGLKEVIYGIGTKDAGRSGLLKHCFLQLSVYWKKTSFQGNSLHRVEDGLKVMSYNIFISL